MCSGAQPLPCNQHFHIFEIYVSDGDSEDLPILKSSAGLGATCRKGFKFLVTCCIWMRSMKSVKDLVVGGVQLDIAISRLVLSMLKLKLNLHSPRGISQKEILQIRWSIAHNRCTSRNCFILKRPSICVAVYWTCTYPPKRNKPLVQKHVQCIIETQHICSAIKTFGPSSQQKSEPVASLPMVKQEGSMGASKSVEALLLSIVCKRKDMSNLAD